MVTLYLVCRNCGKESMNDLFNPHKIIGLEIGWEVCMLQATFAQEKDPVLCKKCGSELKLIEEESDE